MMKTTTRQPNASTFGTLKKLPLKLLFSGGDISMMQFFRALPASPHISIACWIPELELNPLTFHAGAESLVSGRQFTDRYSIAQIVTALRASEWYLVNHAGGARAYYRENGVEEW